MRNHFGEDTEMVVRRWRSGPDDAAVDRRGGVVESVAVDLHFREQEREYYAARQIRRILRDRTVLEVLAVMARRGNSQAAGLLAGGGAR